MPRYEKRGPRKESVYEVVLDDQRVYIADGSRVTGATEWEFTERGIRSMKHADAATAQAAVAKLVEELEGKKYVLVGEATPNATRARLRGDRARSGTLDAALLPLRAKFEAAKTVSLVDAAGGTLSITLVATNLEVERSGKTQTMFFPRLDEALDAATIELFVATTQSGYTFSG